MPTTVRRPTYALIVPASGTSRIDAAGGHVNATIDPLQLVSAVTETPPTLSIINKQTYQALVAWTD
jgi:hypothetical protein